MQRLLVPILLLTLAACDAYAAPAPTPSIVVTNLGPGRFTLENTTATSVRLSADAVLERRTATGWTALTGLDNGGGYRLVESCPATRAAPGGCIDLAAGATIAPVAWSGMSCSSQCNETCRANTHLPGTYRLVVKWCDGKTRSEGAAFEIGALPLMPWVRAGVLGGVTAGTMARADLPITGGYDPANASLGKIAGLTVRVGTKVPMRDWDVSMLVDALSDSKGFYTDVAKRCKSDQHVVFRLTRSLATNGPARTEDVDLSIDFACNRVFVAYPGAGGVRQVAYGFFDDNRAAWLGFARRAFPHDADLAR